MTTPKRPRKPGRKAPPAGQVDLGVRPSLDVEFEARGRPWRAYLNGASVQFVESKDVATIVGTYWGPDMRLQLVMRGFDDTDAREVKLLSDWPVKGDGSQYLAELRDAIVEGFLRNTQPGRRILDKLIRERDAIKQNRTPPATLPMANQAQV